MSGCKTIEYVTPEFTLPDEPHRQVIILSENPTKKEMLLIINYYDGLILEWEIWRDSVKKLLTPDDTEEK